MDCSCQVSIISLWYGRCEYHIASFFFLPFDNPCWLSQKYIRPNSSHNSFLSGRQPLCFQLQPQAQLVTTSIDVLPIHQGRQGELHTWNTAYVMLVGYDH